MICVFVWLFFVGFLTVYKEFCREYHLPETKCQKMKETIQKLKGEKVDIVLGNHPNQNCTISKRKFMIENPGRNPFINPYAWQMFLDALEENRVEFEQMGY